FFLLFLLRQGLPRFALPGPSWPRRAGGGNSRVHRTRARAGMRAGPITAQDVPQSDPGACSRSRRAGCPTTADARVCFLWLLSFAQAKESNSAARMADEKAQGREPVLAKRPNQREQKQMDSRFRGNDGR